MWHAVVVPPNGELETAHREMRDHMPQDGDPARCRCGQRYPCYWRQSARYTLIAAGHLVIDRCPPRGAW